MLKQTLAEEMTVLVRRSALLTQDRKDAILAAVPTMSQEQLEKLRGILAEEPALVSNLADRTISDAIKQGDITFFKNLDAYFVNAKTKLSKTDEVVEKEEENDLLEDFFNDQTT